MQNVKLKLKLLEKNIMHLKRFNRIQEIVNQITTFSHINESLRHQFYDPQAHTAAVALLRSSYNELAIALITEAQDCTNLFLDPGEDVNAKMVDQGDKIVTIEFSQYDNVVYVYRGDYEPNSRMEVVDNVITLAAEAIKEVERVCNIKVVTLDADEGGKKIQMLVIGHLQGRGSTIKAPMEQS